MVNDIFLCKITLYLTVKTYFLCFRKERKIRNEMAQYFLSFIESSFKWVFIKYCFLDFGVAFKRNYSMDFHRGVTKLLEIYSAKDARVGYIKKKF